MFAPENGWETKTILSLWGRKPHFQRLEYRRKSAYFIGLFSGALVILSFGSVLAELSNLHHSSHGSFFLRPGNGQRPATKEMFNLNGVPAMIFRGLNIWASEHVSVQKMHRNKTSHKNHHVNSCKTNEQSSKPWLFAVYQGWNPSQLYSGIIS